MQQMSSSKAKSSSPSQKIPRTLCHSQVHHREQNSLPLVYPEPDKSSPRLPMLFFQDQF